MKPYRYHTLGTLVWVCLWLTMITCTISQAASLTWNAGVNSIWDTVTLNWSGSAWANGSDALFGATGAGTVNLGAGVTANSLTFNNTGFTIAGGTLTLTGAQTVTTNADAAVSSVTAGALTKAGSGTLTLSANSLLNGPNTTVTGGVLNLTGQLYGFNNSSYFVGGQVFVNSGATLRMNGWGWNGDNLGMVNSGNSVILNGGTLEMAGNTANWTGRGFSIGAGGGTLLADSGCTWYVAANYATTVTNNSSLILDGPGTGYLYQAIVGTGSVTKNGTGTWYLGGAMQWSWSDYALHFIGADTYTGNTTVNAGTLLVLCSLAPGSAVTVAGAGTLSGTGSIGGPVTVNGTLAPGTNSIGSLTISNTLALTGTVAMRLSKTGTACLNDSVIGMSSVNYGGTLVLTNPGNSTFSMGDTFTLFASGGYSGSFSAFILPVLTTGLGWDVSNLVLNGTIRVRYQSLVNLSLTPGTVVVAPNGSLQFTAAAYDQYGVAMVVPPPFTWSCIGSGSVNSSGLFTASYGAGTAVITVASGTTQASASVTVPGILPMRWKGVEIGSPGVTGGSSYSGGVYTVNGSGVDIGGSADSFQFNWRFLTGDGEIRARITSQTNTNAAAKAGVMMRSGTGSGALNAFVALTPGGFTFQSRTTSSGTTVTSATTAANAAPNNWVRLVRSGTLFTAYVSASGTSWTQIGTPQTLGMATTVSVGLAVTSHSNAMIGTATFDNVSVTPFPSPWQTMDIGSTVLLGSAESFNGVYTVKGAGTLSGNADKFRFLYQTQSGTNNEIIARISTLQNTSSNNARLGVTIRSGTTTTAPYAFMGVSGAGDYKFQTRSTDGGSTTTTTGVNGTAPNIWVRVVQSGNTFTGYYKSSAGGAWTQVGTKSITTMGTTPCIGIVDASGNTTALNTSVFDNVGGSSITSTPATELQLTSFEDSAAIAQIGAGVPRSQSAQYVTDGTSSLRVDFSNSDYPSIVFPASLFATADWSKAGALMFDAFSADSMPMTIIIRCHDVSGDSWDTTVTLPPGLQQRVAVVLHLPNNVQMDGYPLKNAINADLFGNFGLGFTGNQVASIEFFLSMPGRAQTAYFDNFWLADIAPLVGIVDRYGQSTLSDWSGKIYADQDLVTAHSAEATSLSAQLAALQASTDRDTYGGWAAGPQLAATGWFRTQKLNGKWWLVTPSGHLFWSAGIDCVGPYCANYPGGTGGNMNLFSWLPSSSDPLYGYGTDFYQMNLYRTYGAIWTSPWQSLTQNRMTAWGFNTLGAWGDSNCIAQIQKPFTVDLGDNGDPGNVTTDIYSSTWISGLNTTIANQVQAWSGNPLCLGYYVNNEIGWTGPDSQPVSALLLSGTYAVKGAFTTILQTKYSAINALNTAWGITSPTWTGWADFQANPVALPASRNATLEADLSMLLSAYANQYYSTVNAVLKTCAPNQLYLGSRMSQTPPDEVAVAAGNNCDVVTYNVYGTSEVIASRGQQIVKFDKPVLIGEFHFGALDRGMFFGGMVPVASQQERALDYANYVKAALAQPWCVGAHWFQYLDQPILGRSDGENANIGLVSVADVAYPELVGQATAVNLNIYNTRAAAVVDIPPTIAPCFVTGSSANLSVSGNDLNGGAGLKYTWTVTGTAPGTVTFTPNGTSGAANTMATFTQAGTYNFRVTITDALGEAITSDVGVTTQDWTRSTITLAGTVIVGNMLFGDASPNDHWTVNSGSGGPLTLSGSAGSPMITVNNQPVTFNAVLTGTQGVIKSGTGTLIFTNANTYTGNTDIDSGVLDTGVNGRLYASAPNTTAVVTLYPGSTLRLSGWGSNTTGLGILDCGPNRLVLNGGTIEWAGAIAGSGSRGFSVGPGGATLKASGQGVWTLAHSGNPAYDTITDSAVLNLDGAGTGVLGMDITGTGSLTKTGSGTWVLSGSNTHTGATTVNQGILQVLGSLAQGSAVTVSSAGVLSGTGSIGGPITVNGTLAPGTDIIGSLTATNAMNLTGTATLRLSKSGTNCLNDSAIGLSNINYGGALIVTNIGSSALAVGDAFRFFDAGSYSGDFSLITLPALSVGLAWSTSNLGVNGSITVIPTVWSQWQALQFSAVQLADSTISGFNAAPAGDGVSNQLKYALGLKAFAPSVLPIVTDIETVSGNRYLRLTVTRSPVPSDVTALVEVSGQLSADGWNSADTVVETNTPTTLVVRDSIPVNSASKRFIRLKVTRP